jgi:hypothetical protein
MIEIVNYKPSEHQYRKGSFSIKIPKWGNFLIHELSYFKKGDQRWITFPSRAYEKDGEKKYFPFNSFEDALMKKSFQEKVLGALDKYLATNGQDNPKQADFFSDEKIPF